MHIKLGDKRVKMITTVFCVRNNSLYEIIENYRIRTLDIQKKKDTDRKILLSGGKTIVEQIFLYIR